MAIQCQMITNTRNSDDSKQCMVIYAITNDQGRLPPEVNRILYVKWSLSVVCSFDRNLPFKITNEELYEIFGKYGDIRQIRMYVFVIAQYFLYSRGDTKETRGTAFVVYEDIYDAKDAVEHLSGFNVGGRYLVVLYFQATRQGLNEE